MSRLLEAARNKPPELLKAEDTLKALGAERDRALRVLHQLNAELQEARQVLETAEVKAGDAEARARIDGNKADTKALDTARKNLVAARDIVERLEGTQRGIKRRLAELRGQIAECGETLERAEGAFRKALLGAFAQDLEEAAKHLDPVLREGFALSGYVSLGKTLDVSLVHPETRKNFLPMDVRSLHGESLRTPTSETADEIRAIVGELHRLRWLADPRRGSEVETETDEAEPLPAA